MVRRDPYQVLGVPRDAEQETIKRAYHRLARRYHPDQNPGSSDAAERFQEAVEAHALLINPAARREYDRHGGPVEGRPGESQPDVGGSIRDLVGGVLDGIFGSGPEQTRGRDLRYTLELALSEACLGCEKTITFESLSTCVTCGGDGGKVGASRSAVRCQACDGRGRVKTGPPLLGASHTCTACKGRGRIITVPCETCEGEGVTERKRSFSVKVPPASVDGAIRVLKGQGGASRNGGLPGDLHILIRVAPHPLLRREGHDIWLELPLSLAQATLGAEITVPTLEGRVDLKIPPGAQPGKILVLEGRGVPKKDSSRGDLLVRLDLELPTDVTDRQRKLLEEFESMSGEKQSPKVANYAKKVKELGE